MAVDPNFNQNEIDAKSKRTQTTTRVINVIFYTLVIACAILGEYYWLSLSNFALYNAWIFSDAFLKLLSGFLILYSLLKFKALVKRMR